MPTTRKDFEDVFPRLVDDLITRCKEYNVPQHAQDWYHRSLYHNVVGGKYNRGLSVPDTVAILQPDAETPATSPSSPAFFPAATLGWLIELLQSYFLVSDDIMDRSHTRRGQPCWYRLPEVSMIAINDSFMIEAAIFLLLKKHFRQHSNYVEIAELFQEVSFLTELGQCLDLITAPEDAVNLENFNMQKYVFIVHFKTAYYSFYLPVAIALHYCALATPKNLEQAKDILIPMGEYFQIQDDYLDAYADASVIGKIGTDIQDNKCSWLINQALKRASAEQRQVLDENYGRKDKDAEVKVKQVYKDLNLEQVYNDYEESKVSEIRQMIENVDESEGLKKGVFEEFLKKIYKRTK